MLLGHGPSGHAEKHTPSEITLDIAPAKAVEPIQQMKEDKPVPPKASAAKDAPRTRVRRAARATEPAPEAKVAPPTPEPPAAEEPVDLTGVTLTDGTSGAGWASAVGNGQGMHGPLGRAPSARPRGASGDSALSTSGDRLVGAADLKRAPTPPELQAELEREYPLDARRDGVAGEARVRARVRRDGAVDRIRIVAATVPSFGDACRRVLGPSHWSPPLDRDGNACATEITYVCRFEVLR